MNRLFISVLLLFFLASCQQSKELSDYVNPFTGTGGHGHTYPGAAVPFGMVQLSPDTRLTGWDGCSAYHYSDSVVYGFSHTHLSGTGVSDYGDILFMPTTGQVKLQKGSPENRSEGYCSRFSHNNEVAEAGYYKTYLDDYGVEVELTATERAGFHHYRFTRKEEANVILDLEHRDKVLDSYLKIVSDTKIEGYRISDAWARKQYVYFVAEFSKPFTTFGIAENDTVKADLKELTSTAIKAFFKFDTKSDEILKLKVGISGVDIEGARKNLEKEIPDWDFDKIKSSAKAKWNKELSKIEVTSSDKEKKEIFYTSLYHSFLNPNVYTDVDGRFRGTDLKVHQAHDFTNYTVFSLWDTYRATHPLFTLVQQERTTDFIKTFLVQYQKGGILPMWELAGNYTQCMIGYHAVPVIADAYLKGITDFDAEKALEAMIYSAEHTQLGLEAYQKYGFIALDKEHESVSKNLEYAYDDWTIAQMAKAMGKNEIYEKFIVRAQYYKNLFDKETGFMRPKMNGGWQKPFDPKEVNFNFTEANSWQYSFYVPQDVSGLIALHGGEEAFDKKLDNLFSESSNTTGRHQVDITGLIGQYAHGNEPSHHIAYLYNFVGKPWKTQEKIHQIMREMYTNKPDGLCGNEDCGQMSSWYVLSAMGFYPVTPGSTDYAIGTPLFEEVKLNAGKKPFVIKANNLSEENFYIRSVSLNGEDYTKSFISHQAILEGGELVFEMGNTPNKEWAKAEENRINTEITDKLLLPVPYFEADNRTFYDSLTIEIKSAIPETAIYYTLDGTEPDENSKLYTESFRLSESTTIRAISIDKDGNKSFVIEGEYFKIPKNRSIKIISKYNSQYTAGGDNGIIDFLRGGDDFRNGSWQGYQDQDFEAVVDFGKPERISQVGGGFLQDIRSWIWMPTKVEFWSSNDGTNFKSLGMVENTVPEEDYDVTVKDFMLKISPQKFRYLKVKATNYGTIPDWHLGHGGEAFIFIDEIIVE